MTAAHGDPRLWDLAYALLDDREPATITREVITERAERRLAPAEIEFVLEVIKGETGEE
jgi:hypothetical protein